jgi:hypothetical protein
VTDRKSSADILMTSCQDNICRIWAETVPRIKQLTSDQTPPAAGPVITENSDKKKRRLVSTFHRIR